MKSYFISDWFEDDNPYKTLLIKHIVNQDILVEEYPKRNLFLIEILQAGKPDILHLHTCKYFFISRSKVYQWLKFSLFISQLFWLKILGVKIVWTVHEWDNKVSNRKYSFSIVQTKILGLIFDGIITHCVSTKTRIVKELYIVNSDKVCVIPHGNYIDWYDNKLTLKQSRQILDINQNSFTFLIFGGIHWGKGILSGIEAFNKLPQKNLNLIIAGKTGNKKLKELILEKIKDRENINLVSLEEGVPDSEIQVYFNACDCLVLPYKAFTTSGIALLAMSFGKVCIAPDSGFFHDIFDEQLAFLYETKKDDSLVYAMLAAIENKSSLSTMGMRNFELAKKWNWDYVAKETADLYQSLKKHPDTIKQS